MNAICDELFVTCGAAARIAFAHVGCTGANQLPSIATKYGGLLTSTSPGIATSRIFFYLNLFVGTAVNYHIPTVGYKPLASRCARRCLP